MSDDALALRVAERFELATLLALDATAQGGRSRPGMLGRRA